MRAIANNGADDFYPPNATLNTLDPCALGRLRDRLIEGDFLLALVLASEMGVLPTGGPQTWDDLFGLAPGMLKQWDKEH
jgi:hypothetical protein